ncbi:hypothetical protein A3D01_01070 [Candidatus Woesebacteria bacterium RIFCSPHIGHO2_02_FULL_39_13]|uniref:Uncharacterized protein n=1 Tax=Candidatus Woesebacteria bacterium RIFCSPHIGHO2_02_FULL_39_13 TaxID=1802505 RepID=A0A1F7Z1B2_9BACT|nr:MAG: hypothetical protein A3D01_01070 [Candidatus Woesebacteria bacterium RIFCSPHIGHO2_02_FULL_39_13]OGM37921.1 MAG: hypothetical protein A3E13_04420 [Candidatus Woesebacteria bacterium RIFCSPHIGHO2_12_FULL_40_20]OGM74363.1 MAG: hypothetical protein A3H19_01920 [Candidatus Woesebacteria bacterium RIFCSPLOWO2_12_FULL_39_9]
MGEAPYQIVSTTTSQISGGAKIKTKILIFFILAIFILTAATGIILYIKSTSPPRDLIREEQFTKAEIPDLYPGVPFEVVEPLYVRARLVRFEGDTLTYGVFSPAGEETKSVTLNDKVVFGCTQRYMITPDGTQIDKLSMYITTRGKEDISDIPDPPDAKAKEWFAAIAKNGEAIEIRYIKTQEAVAIPRIIYVYKDNCS